MKAKFLFILLSVLFIIPTSAVILNKHKHKIRLTSFTLRNKATTRSPIEFNIDVQETNSCLQIIFLSPLPDAEITITDKNGKTPNGYPYTVKIISPIMDITGDIIEEESE